MPNLMNEVFSYSSTYSTMQSVVKDAKSIRDSLMGTYQNTSVRVSELKRNNKHIHRLFQWFKKESEDPENNGPSSFEEDDDEFDAGFRYNEDGNEEPSTQVLDAEQMRTFAADQTREMHKIAQQKLEAKIYTTSEIINVINTRSSETLAMLRTVDSETSAIANKLDVLIKTTETMLERIRKEQRVSNMHNYSGRMTIGTFGDYIKNNRRAVTKSITESVMDMTGLTALDRQVNEAVQSFQHNMLMKLFEIPFIKKYMNPYEQRTSDYSIYVSNDNNREAAVFDNMTRKTIITVIPDYLKQITAIVTGKTYHIASSGALTTTAPENKFVKSIDVTFESAQFSDRSFTEMTTNAKKVDKDFSSADMREVIRVLIEQYVAKNYLSPEAKNHINPKVFENGGDQALHLHVAQLLAKGKGKTVDYWLNIIGTFSTALMVDKNYRSNFSASINKAMKALDNAAARNIVEAQHAIDTQFTQKMFDERALTRMGHDSSEFEYEGKTLRDLVKKDIIKMESLTEDQRRNIDKPIKKFSEIADTITGDDDVSHNLFKMQDDNLKFLRGIFDILNKGVNVYFMKKRRGPFAKIKKSIVIEPPKSKQEEQKPTETPEQTIPEIPSSPLPQQEPESHVDEDEEERISETTHVLTTAATMGVTNPAQVLSTIGPMGNPVIQQRMKTIFTGTIERAGKKEPHKSRLGKIFAFVFAISKSFITRILSGAKAFLNSKVANFVKSMMESSVDKIKTGASAVKEAFKGSEESPGLIQRIKTKSEEKKAKKNKPTMESIGTGDIWAAKVKNKLQEFRPVKALSSFGNKIKDKLSKSQFGQGILSSFKKKERNKFKIQNLGDQSTSKIEEMLATTSPVGTIFGAFLDAFDRLQTDIQDWFDALGEQKDEEKKKQKAQKAAPKKKKSIAFDFGKIVGGLMGMLSGLIQAALTVVMSLKGVQKLMDLVHNVLTNALKPLNKAFKSLYKAIKPVMKTIQNVLKQIVQYVVDIVESLITIMQPIIEAISPIIMQLMDVLKPLLEMVTGLVESLVTPLVAVMQTVVVPILQGIANNLQITLGIVQVGIGSILTITGGIMIAVGVIGKVFGAGSLFDSGKSVIEIGTSMVKAGSVSVINGLKSQVALVGSLITGETSKTKEPDEPAKENKRHEQVVEVLNGSPMDGIYGAGDANAPYKFDDSVQDALSTIRSLASGIFSMFDPDKDDTASKLQTAKDREAYAKAQMDTADLSDEERASVDAKAFELFKSSVNNEQLIGESDTDYKKRYEQNKAKYWAQAATEILHERVKRVADGSDEGAYALTNQALGLNEDDKFAKQLSAYDKTGEKGSAISAMADFMTAVMDNGEDDGYYDDEYYYEGGTGDIFQAAAEVFVAARKAAGGDLHWNGTTIRNLTFDDGMVIDKISPVHCTSMMTAIVKRMGYYVPSGPYTDTYQGTDQLLATAGGHGATSWGLQSSDGHPNIFDKNGQVSNDWIMGVGNPQAGDITFGGIGSNIHAHMGAYIGADGNWFGFNGGADDSLASSVKLGEYYLKHGSFPTDTRLNPVHGKWFNDHQWTDQAGALAAPMTYWVRYVGPKTKSRRKVKKSSSESDYKYSGSFKPRLSDADRPEAGNKYYITQGAGGWSRAIVGSPTDRWNNVLSNCTGYGYGRFHEIAGDKTMNLFDPVDAGDIYENAIAHGRKVSSKPSLGAALILGQAGHAGHIAIVEKINKDGSILTSESGYGCTDPFWVQERKPANNYAEGGYYFKGFIHQDKSIKVTSKASSTKSSSKLKSTSVSSTSAKKTSTKKTTTSKKTTTKKGRNAWIDTVAMMFEGYYYNGDKYYDNVNTHTFKIRDGRTVKARPDCSGMLGAAMTAMGYQLDYPPSSTHYNVTGMNGNLNFIHDPDGSVSKDWKLIKFTGNNLQPGDITGNKYHASFPVTNLSAPYPKGFDAGGTTNIKESAIAARAYLDGKSDIPWRSAMGSGAFSAGAGAWNIVRYVGDGAVTYDYGDDDYDTTSSSSRRTIVRTRQDRVAEILKQKSAAIRGVSYTPTSSTKSKSKSKSTSSKNTKSSSKGKERLIRSTAEIFEAYQKTNPALTYQCSIWPKPITTRSGHTRQVRPDCSGTISAGIQEMGFTLRSPNGALTGDSGLRSIELGNQSTNTLIFDSPTAKKPSTKWQVLDYSKDKLQRGDITVYPNSGTGKNDGHVTMPITDLQTTPRGFDGGSGLQRTPAAAVAYLAGKKDTNIPYPENAGMSKMRKIWRYTGSGDAETQYDPLFTYNEQPMDEFMSTIATGYSDSMITPDLFEDIPYQETTGPMFVPSFDESVMQPTESDEVASCPTIINNFTAVSGLDYIEQHLDEFTNNEFQVQSIQIRQLANQIAEEFPEYIDYYFDDDEEDDVFSVIDDMEIRELLSVAP